jgi:hypothetical protein
MVCLTDPELDCVIERRPPARCQRARRLPARGGGRAGELPAIGDGVVHRGVAEVQRRHCLPPEFRDGKARRSGGIWLESSPYAQARHGPTRFVAEAEKFRTRSLGERACKPQERETS